MLLELPKDILKYILSLVICDYYSYTYDRTARIRTNRIIDEYIALMSLEGRFDQKCEKSHMSYKMIMLSQTHPKIRRILKDVSVFDGNGSWGFDEMFFHTLTNLT